MKKEKKISDQDAIILASDYTITSFGLKDPHLPDSIVTIDINGNEMIITNPTEEELEKAVQRNLEHKFGDTYTIVDSIHDPATGLDGVLIFNKETDSHIVVFQGSQTSYAAIDWLKTNPALADNKVDEQHLEALRKAEEWMGTYKIEGVAGNSLAGGLVQLLVMAHPELWGRTINPAGVNQAMVDYVKTHYGIIDEQLNTLDLINFYTDTDILHRLLGLEMAGDIQSKNEHYQDLYQLGMQLLLENAGDFSLENMGIEHTGHNRMTIYGPFDPLTGDFMKGSRIVSGNGRVHYTVAASTEIELNPEELTRMACKLASSLDAHADEIDRVFQEVEVLLGDSSREIDLRSGAVVDLVEEAFRSSGGGWFGLGILNALNSPWSLAVFIKEAPNWVRLKGFKLNVQDAGVLWLEQFAIRRWLDAAINGFLDACGLQNEAHMRSETVYYPTGHARQSGYAVINKQYFENSYLDAPMEEAFRNFMTKCLADSKKTIIAMDYYAEALLHAAEVFAAADENASKLLADIGEIRKQTVRSGGGARLNAVLDSDVSLMVSYDEVAFMGGLNDRKRELMDDNFYLFKDFFRRVIGEVKVNIIPQVIACIEGNRKANEYSDFQHYLQVHSQEIIYGLELGASSERRYRMEYKAYNEGVVAYNQEVDACLVVVRRMASVLNALPVEDVIPGQFKEQIFQLLFKDNALYDFMQQCQRLAAHHAVGAQLVAQTTANLSYNTGTAIDALVDIGRKVQEMLEVGESHLMRVRV